MQAPASQKEVFEASTYVRCWRDTLELNMVILRGQEIETRPSGSERGELRAALQGSGLEQC